MPSGGGFAFGPFRLYTVAKRLERDGVDVSLPPTQLDLLLGLVCSAGKVVSKDHLLQLGWHDTIVSDNSLNQAMSRLRAALDPSEPARYIATVARRGYCFTAPVEPFDAGLHDADLDALIAPERAWIDGRAALESLELAQIARARAAFEQLLQRHAGAAQVHVGFASACAMQFESTRADAAPDLAALRLAEQHARTACRLNPDYAEAWATLGFVLARTGQSLDARAALVRATILEPRNWRHRARLAWVSWGEERLQAAATTLALLPGCAIARWLAATVYVARGLLTDAEREIDAALASLPTASPGSTRLSAVAIHWFKGLLALARGDAEAALVAFECELALEARGHLYSREITANTWCALGAVRLQQHEPEAARQAFEQARIRLPTHPMSQAMSGASAPAAPASVEEAFARAAVLVATGNAPAAARLVDAALLAAPPGSAGWRLPIEPLLGVQHARDVWSTPLVTLGNRAV